MERVLRRQLPELNGSQLKIIAMSAMLIDHIGAFLLINSQWYALCRSIGRIAFPIFCMMIAEGAVHTRSITKYAGRLLAFAIISTPPYNLVHGDDWYCLEELNVFFTLLFGLLGIASIKELAPRIFKLFDKSKLAESKAACFWCGVPFCVILYLAAYALKTDYGGYGAATVLIFYLLRGCQFKAWSVFALFTFACYGIGFVSIYHSFSLNVYNLLMYAPWRGGYHVEINFARQFLAPLAVVPASFYNGKKGGGGNVGKYLFYAFYPLHLIVIWLIQLAMDIL